MAASVDQAASVTLATVDEVLLASASSMNMNQINCVSVLCVLCNVMLYSFRLKLFVMITKNNFHLIVWDVTSLSWLFCLVVKFNVCRKEAAY
ncbi:hypothetical protein RND71_030858 [Anisodus tanguticus]|uniref:Uncharacterized protein n=1 Tax=Anisodus tanguticus TaxID=243964 RepID=A0AAE1RFZ4_9SOLA|nr:hypothetical protein RND71_030858 [Anisodus tanguticus]